MASNMRETRCFHCGDICKSNKINFLDKHFCCKGCKTVFEILNNHNLNSYYELQDSPGTKPNTDKGKFDVLINRDSIEKLIEFENEDIQISTLYIPHIHCSSCIWVLENLDKLNNHIINATVNFGKKTVRITYSTQTNLKAVVVLLSAIGYEPYINPEDDSISKKTTNRALLYKLAVAGFSFGAIMLLSLPAYFEGNDYWLEQYKHVLRGLMFGLSLPVVFYAAQNYFVSAYKGLKAKLLHIDVPIALGISVVFIRSTVEIALDISAGFFDSLTGLVFFLLIGKYFQQKTYDFLSFERDYKSYFPIAVTKIDTNGKETITQVYNIQKGDRLLIRNEEIIPVDGILISGKASIDYSFVTGESQTVTKTSGDILFAGGKQTKGAIQLEVVKPVKQSYLTQLWNSDVFHDNKQAGFTSITNVVSRYFTITILAIATIATMYWVFNDVSKAMHVFTAVLIIACPCAIALSAPFTFGNLLRIFGKLKFYVKNASVIEQMTQLNTIIFDKTGTITSNASSRTEYSGENLTKNETLVLKNSLRGSNHPLSRALSKVLDEHNIVILDTFEEHLGKGIEAKHSNINLKIGSANFVGAKDQSSLLNTTVHISINNNYKGSYTFYNSYRKGISKLFKQLKSHYDLAILSGDNEGEHDNLKKLLPSKTKLIFNQTPEDKLNYIKFHQSEGAKVMMVGDGLNDAAALAQSDVGVTISEDINVFSPACDAILDASKLPQLNTYIDASKMAMCIVKWSFALSFLYNIVGVYFAVTGQLAPVIAAILMPLSSISIVVFTTCCTTILGKTLK